MLRTDRTSSEPYAKSEVARFSTQISQPEIAADYEKLAETTRKLTETEAKIKTLYDEWEIALKQLG